MADKSGEARIYPFVWGPQGHGTRPLRTRIPAPYRSPAHLLAARLQRARLRGDRRLRGHLHPGAVGGRALLRPAADDLVPAQVPPVVVRLEPRTAAIHQPVTIYLSLMDDRYPATDDHQSVHLDYS